MVIRYRSENTKMLSDRFKNAEYKSTDTSSKPFQNSINHIWPQITMQYKLMITMTST